MNIIVYCFNIVKFVFVGVVKFLIYEDVVQSDLLLWKKLVQCVDDFVIVCELCNFFDDNLEIVLWCFGVVIVVWVIVQCLCINYVKGCCLGQ